MPTAKVNGAEIYYEEAGSGSPLILSPGGLQGTLASYQPVSDQLSQAYRVIVYDRRFGGQSTSPLVVQTWDLVCQDVIGLMDVLGIEQASLGGGSFGAAIALGCAVRYPERVWAIVPSNIAGGVICEAYLAMKLFKIHFRQAPTSSGGGCAMEMECTAAMVSTSLPRPPRAARHAG